MVNSCVYNNTIWIMLDGKLLVDDLINLPSIQFDLKMLKARGFVLGYRNIPDGKFLGEMTLFLAKLT